MGEWRPTLLHIEVVTTLSSTTYLLHLHSQFELVTITSEYSIQEYSVQCDNEGYRGTTG